MPTQCYLHPLYLVQEAPQYATAGTQRQVGSLADHLYPPQSDTFHPPTKPPVSQPWASSVEGDQQTRPIPTVIRNSRSLYAVRIAMHSVHRFGRHDSLLWLARGPRRRRAMFSWPKWACASSKPHGSNGPPYQSNIARTSSRAGSRIASTSSLEAVRPTDIRRRHVPSPLHICPSFVRIAARRGAGTRNPAEFLDSSICSAKYPERLSSCRKRLRSIPRPRLTLHEVLSLGPGPDGTITIGDETLIRPRRRDWSRPALLANLVLC